MWAVVAAMSAVVVVASVVGSVATGMGWWSWGRRQIRLGPQQAELFVIADGGIRYSLQAQVPVLSGIPIVGNFFWMQAPAAAWVPRVSISSGQREVIVPFWTVGAVAVFGFLFAWPRARRAMPGECSKCGYDLKGLADGAVCPECGTKAPAVIEGAS